MDRMFPRSQLKRMIKKPDDAVRETKRHLLALRKANQNDLYVRTNSN